MEAGVVDQIDRADPGHRFVVAIEHQILGPGDRKPDVDPLTNALGWHFVEGTTHLDRCIQPYDTRHARHEGVIDLVDPKPLDESRLGAGQIAVERLHADAAVASQVVVITQPLLEACLQSFERHQVRVFEPGQEAQAHRAMKSLDLAAGRRVEGLAVQECAADARTRFCEMPRDESRAVVAIKSLRHPVGRDRVTKGV